MGTDIYCAIERHDGERWRFAAPLELERNRYLFEVLALGDRPIAAPRGLPPDGDPKTDTMPLEYDEADYADRFGGRDIYKRLPAPVLPELQRVNPVVNGQRRAKHHQI